MSRIIAIANQKGGVGKTTTSVNLSAALVGLRKKVLLIDLDPQGNATMGCGVDKHEVDTGIFDVLVDGMPIPEALTTVAHNVWDVLAANSDLTAAEVELMSMEGREHRLYDALRTSREHYDYILIDCPPSLNILTLNAFVATDSVLVPVQCEYYALEGLSALLETIDGVRESVNPNIAIEGLLRTMYDGRNKLGLEVSAQLVEHFGDQVLQTVVPRNVRLAEAPSHGVSILEYDATSRGALAYLALAGEIVRRNAAALQETADQKTSEHLDTQVADQVENPNESAASSDNPESLQSDENVGSTQAVSPSTESDAPDNGDFAANGNELETQSAQAELTEHQPNDIVPANG